MNKLDCILIGVGLVMGIAIGFLTGTSYAMSAQDEVSTQIQCQIVSDTMRLDRDSTRLSDGTYCIN